MHRGTANGRLRGALIPMDQRKKWIGTCYPYFSTSFSFCRSRKCQRGLHLLLKNNCSRLHLWRKEADNAAAELQWGGPVKYTWNLKVTSKAGVGLGCFWLNWWRFSLAYIFPDDLGTDADARKSSPHRIYFKLASGAEPVPLNETWVLNGSPKG